MGTSQSTVCCPVRLDDFVYETPVKKRTRVQVRPRRKARGTFVWSPEGSPPAPSNGKACRMLVFPDAARKRRAARGMAHQWMPRAGVLNRMWCKKPRRRLRNAFPRPNMFLR